MTCPKSGLSSSQPESRSPMRPQFHFTAERGWINDPHGITYRDGQYHLFYQHVPDSRAWAAHCHWGHAVSKDLLSFETRPIAIAPGDGDDGIWTGALITDDSDRSTIFYTSVAQPGIELGRVRIATPTDAEWIGWRKGAVVAEAPHDLDLVGYRDPFVFRDGVRWRMLLGAGLADGTAAALSYFSDDLAKWSYEGIAVERSSHATDPVWTGALWECPQLFELDGRHVMVTSVWQDHVLHYVAYALGNFQDGKFDAQTWGRLSFGDSLYAPSFFRDADGGASLLFWLRHVEDVEAGWAGAHSVPYSLSIIDDRLVATPHRNLESHRRPPLNDNTVGCVAADVSWTGTHLAISSAGRDVAALTVDTTTLSLRVGDESWSMPFDRGHVRVIIDGPIMEISTPCGVMAAAIQPTGDELTVTGDGDIRHLSSLTRS